MPPGAQTPLDVDDYAWSADGRRLLIFTNTKKVWRQNTRGDYWVLELGSGALTKIGGGAPESTMMFAKFSPDGSRVAYVRANNIYVGAWTTGGSPNHERWVGTTINGTSDWVYEEELGSAMGSVEPDGRASRTGGSTAGIGIFSLINDTDALYRSSPATRTKAGTVNSAVQLEW